MYRMMIVEDEDIERRYLCKHIDWARMGIEITAALESGEEALEYSIKNEIDILLTDIKLIGMSGLQLAKQLLKQKPEIKVVILTGYQEFEYARVAVELHAVSFLTKPVDEEELNEVFAKIVMQCANEESERLEKERLYHLVEQNMPVLKDRFFDSLVTGGLPEADISRNLAYFQLSISGNYYNVLVSEIDGFTDISAGMDQQEVHLYILKVLDCVRAACNSDRHITFHMKGGKYCTILSLECTSSDDLHYESINLAQKIQEWVNEQCGVDVTIGIGKGSTRLSDLKFPYKQACDAAAYKFFMGNNQIIHYNDVSYYENNSSADLDEPAKQVVLAIELCDRENMEINLGRLFAEISRSSCNDTYIRNVCINLTSKVSVMLMDMHESFGNIFGSEMLVWEKLLRLDTVFDIQLWMKNIFNAIIDHLIEKKSGCNKKIIQDILKYIDDNYCKNITISDISQHVYLSPNYISILFKKETGESFTNFLIRYRMEKAAQMLRESNFKVYEIGDRVGYPNTSHFCSVFKKQFGVSPNEFRERI